MFLVLSSHGFARLRVQRPLVLCIIAQDAESSMSLGLILLIVLVLLLVGAIPAWPHSSGWGYGPSGGIGLVLLIVIILLLMGKL